jgi:DeoR/GlpR family transcriptional regulator of sugar metabolism
MNSRQNQILEVLAKNQRIEVAKLADMLNVSSVTIRKDLDALEAQHLTRREHGFASIDHESSEGYQLAYHYCLKRRIAKVAAATVHDNETVMIGSGSWCVILAEELTNTKRDITIITNSVFLVNRVRNNPYGKTILLGGYYQRDSQVLVGPLIRESAKLFSIDKFFISASGFSEEFGFTAEDYTHVQTIQELSKQAQKLVMLFDSEKFSNIGVVKLAAAENISALYTDDLIPPDKEAFFLEKNITVHKVAAA